MEISTIIDFVNIYNKSDEDLLGWLQENKLIRKSLKCKERRCRRVCVVTKKNDYPLGVSFRCKTCRTHYSVLGGSFFSQRKLPIRMVLLIMWYWATGSRTRVTSAATGSRRGSVIQVYRFIRNVISWKIVKDEEYLLGGHNHVVQIDQSLITKRKFERGRLIPERRVVGIYDVTLKKGYIHYVNNWSAEMLEIIISAHVLPGTEVWTDRWRGYNNLSNIGYIHKHMNHSRHFIDPITGVRNNMVEGYLCTLKKYLRRLDVIASPFLPEYIDQFLWDQNYGKTAKDRFRNILCHISEKYMVSD